MLIITSNINNALNRYELIINMSAEDKLSIQADRRVSSVSLNTDRGQIQDNDNDIFVKDKFKNQYAKTINNENSDKFIVDDKMGPYSGLVGFLKDLILTDAIINIKLQNELIAYNNKLNDIIEHLKEKNKVITITKKWFNSIDIKGNLRQFFSSPYNLDNDIQKFVSFIIIKNATEQTSFRPICQRFLKVSAYRDNACTVASISMLLSTIGIDLDVNECITFSQTDPDNLKDVAKFMGKQFTITNSRHLHNFLGSLVISVNNYLESQNLSIKIKYSYLNADDIERYTIKYKVGLVLRTWLPNYVYNDEKLGGHCIFLKDVVRVNNIRYAIICDPWGNALAQYADKGLTILKGTPFYIIPFRALESLCKTAKDDGVTNSTIEKKKYSVIMLY